MPSLKKPSRPKRAAATTSAALPSSDWKQSFRRALRAWFDAEKRDLPWRKTRDPYAVWVSEIMLQQTQVATVVAYYRRFLSTMPTIAALAAAPESDVLRLWEGLGYYRRARQLHRAAKEIVAEHGGKFPRDVNDVRRLPGIGRYTAGAILSIAFDLPQPILEANTIRLLSRLAAYAGDSHSRSGQQLLWSWATALVPRAEPGLFNQALMELGALVCTPREPRCEQCPVKRLCPTRRLGLQDRIPRPKAKPRFEKVREAAVLVRRGAKVLVVERAEGERWAGLWDFPRFELSAETSKAVAEELRTKIESALGICTTVGARRATLKHGVTRFRITLEAHDAEYAGGTLRVKQFAAARWIRPTQLADYPMNTTGRKLAALLSAQ